jgi:hypothetical protein
MQAVAAEFSSYRRKIPLPFGEFSAESPPKVGYGRRTNVGIIPVEDENIEAEEFSKSLTALF